MCVCVLLYINICIFKNDKQKKSLTKNNNNNKVHMIRIKVQKKGRGGIRDVIFFIENIHPYWAVCKMGHKNNIRAYQF